MLLSLTEVTGLSLESNRLSILSLFIEYFLSIKDLGTVQFALSLL